MEIKETMCYSRLVFLMIQGADWEQAVSEVTYTAPQFKYEGVAGYVETKVTFKVKDLSKFVELWNRWVSLPIDKRTKFYRLVANDGDTCV